jgi:hypothetical protein
MVSRDPDDMREGYCGACHDWTGSILLAGRVLSPGETLAEAMRGALEVASAMFAEQLADIGRAMMGAGIVPTAGVREGRGDPSGDPPLSCGGGTWRPEGTTRTGPPGTAGA